jgi:hypothetical protein
LQPQLKLKKKMFKRMMLLKLLLLELLLLELMLKFLPLVVSLVLVVYALLSAGATHT